MTRRAAVLLVLALCVGCAHPAPSLSPKGVAAFQATRIVKGLDLLRDAAIDANAQTPPVLTTEDTRRVVTYHKLALQVIDQLPSGWIAMITTGMDSLAADLPPPSRQRLAPYFSLVKTLLAEVQ